MFENCTYRHNTVYIYILYIYYIYIPCCGTYKCTAVISVILEHKCKHKLQIPDLDIILISFTFFLFR